MIKLVVLDEYSGVLVIFAIAFFFAILIFSLSYFFIRKSYDPEKISPYECGFDPFGDARLRFNVKFYLVSLLFVIFDLEVVFLFPWAVSLPYISFFGYVVMLFFIFLLTLGFLYEWARGALEWE